MKTAKRPKPLKVHVTAEDIREGVAGDCFSCAVARAVERATGDDHANLYRRDYVLYIEAWSRSVEAPPEVCRFVTAFDDTPEGETPADWYGRPLEPFAFELPHAKSREWKERCYGCEELFAPSKLDDDGCCPACRDD